MKLLLNQNEIQNKLSEMKSNTDNMTNALYSIFTEAANGAGYDEIYSGGPLFDFINKRTSKINIMTKPFHIMSDIEHFNGFTGSSAYLDELGYLSGEADIDVFNGYLSDKIRYIILDLMSSVVKQIAYEFDWIDENYIYESFRNQSQNMYSFIFRQFNSNMMQLLNRAYNDYYGDNDTNYEDNILIMAGPMIEYLSISITTVVADMIFNVLYNIVFAIADGETYRLACDTISEIIISFKNSISKMITSVIVETIHHRGQISTTYEQELDDMRNESREIFNNKHKQREYYRE